MCGMSISAERAAERPKRDVLAAAVLDRCRAWFEDPEHERDYQKWKQEKEKEGA